MKKLFTLFIALAFSGLIGSCEESEPGIESKLAGRWESLGSNSGWGGSDANGRIIEFTKKTYTFYDKDTLTKQGQYLIIQAKSYLTGEKENMILFDITAEQAKKMDYVRSMIDVNDTLLTLTVDAYDGPTAFYQRID